MAYHGYIPWIHKFSSQFEKPVILEIGVHSGQTLFPLAQRYSANNKKFRYIGVDVLLRDYVKVVVEYMDLKEGDQEIMLFETTSLDFLSQCRLTFDVVLLDGDHNYHTVSKELPLLANILRPGGVIVCDDYEGKYAEKDQYFSEIEECKHIETLVKREDVDPSKQGVKTAVNEFCEENPEWEKVTFYSEGEPVILFRKGEIDW